MLSYKLRNMPIFIMIAILLMACGNAAITQPQQEVTRQPEITPSSPIAELIDSEEGPAVEEQKEEHLPPTPTVSVDESEKETSTSPLPTPAATGEVMAEENVISTVVTITTATPPTNTTAITATPVLTAGSEGWRAENIEAEGVIELALPAALSAQSEQKTARNFLYPAISPNSQYLLIEKKSGQAIPCYEDSDDCLKPISDLWLYDFTTGQWRVLVKSSFKGVWSPDGTRIAYLTHNNTPSILHELQYLSLADGFTRTVVTDALWSQPYWRDNQNLVYLGQDRYITQISLDGTYQHRLSSIQIPRSQPVNFALSANGSSLAIVDNRDLWLVDLETAQEPLLLSPEEEHLRYADIVQGLAWSSDGQYLAFATRYSVTVYNKAGDFISSFGGGDPTHSLVWSPDNRSIAFISYVRNLEGDIDSAIVIGNVDGTETEAFARAPEMKYTLDWSATGSYLIWGTSSAEVGPPKRLDLRIR